MKTMMISGATMRRVAAWGLMAGTCEASVVAEMSAMPTGEDQMPLELDDFSYHALESFATARGLTLDAALNSMLDAEEREANGASPRTTTTRRVSKRAGERRQK